jgi:prepilin peptidase CpaA
MIDVALLVVFPALMAYAAASDLVTMTIPNRVSLALVVAFVCLALAEGIALDRFLLHVAAGALVLCVSFGFFARGWIGGGDAKLAAATALWLGFDSLLEYLFAASLLGGGLTLAILALRRAPPLPFGLPSWEWLARLSDDHSGIPYGIALAVAALAVYPHSAIWTRAFVS